MIVSFTDIVRRYAEEPLTRQLLMDLLKDYKRPYDKMHELVRSGELLSARLFTAVRSFASFTA